MGFIGLIGFALNFFNAGIKLHKQASFLFFRFFRFFMIFFVGTAVLITVRVNVAIVVIGENYIRSSQNVQAEKNNSVIYRTYFCFCVVFCIAYAGQHQR